MAHGQNFLISNQATGIATGMLIIATFTVFERKRQEVLQMIEHLKTWER
jgi:hypothetical protein